MNRTRKLVAAATVAVAAALGVVTVTNITNPPLEVEAATWVQIPGNFTLSLSGTSCYAAQGGVVYQKYGRITIWGSSKCLYKYQHPGSVVYVRVYRALTSSGYIYKIV